MNLTAMNLRESLWGVRCVWLRYFSVYCKDITYSIIITFAEPLLYLASFGYGMGSLIDTVYTQGQTVSYRPFLFSGILSQTILFQAYFYSAYGSFVRMYYQRIFKAMATTPLTLNEVLWGELLWDATHATLSGFAVIVMGVLFKQFDLIGALLCIPLSFLGGLLFSGFGLSTAAWAKTIEKISYPQLLIIFPMFLFCGTYYPLERLPEMAQKISWVLPLTPLCLMLRGLTLNLAYPWYCLPVLVLWTVFFVWLSINRMTKRLIQ